MVKMVEASVAEEAMGVIPSGRGGHTGGKIPGNPYQHTLPTTQPTEQGEVNPLSYAAAAQQNL
eukprot:3516981-Ditylum_brightwellii.AAC.1